MIRDVEAFLEQDQSGLKVNRSEGIHNLREKIWNARRELFPEQSSEEFSFSEDRSRPVFEAGPNTLFSDWSSDSLYELPDLDEESSFEDDSWVEEASFGSGTSFEASTPFFGATETKPAVRLDVTCIKGSTLNRTFEADPPRLALPNIDANCTPVGAVPAVFFMNTEAFTRTRPLVSLDATFTAQPEEVKKTARSFRSVVVRLLRILLCLG